MTKSPSALSILSGFEDLVEALAAPVSHDLDRPNNREGAKFSRFDLTGRQIIVYLDSLKAGRSPKLIYRIHAPSRHSLSCAALGRTA